MILKCCHTVQPNLESLLKRWDNQWAEFDFWKGSGKTERSLICRISQFNTGANFSQYKRWKSPSNLGEYTFIGTAHRIAHSTSSYSNSLCRKWAPNTFFFFPPTNAGVEKGLRTPLKFRIILVIVIKYLAVKLSAASEKFCCCCSLFLQLNKQNSCSPGTLNALKATSSC